MLGVRIDCIAPGPFMTSIANGRLKIPADRNAFEEQPPIGGIRDPEEWYVAASQLVIHGGAMRRIK